MSASIAALIRESQARLSTLSDVPRLEAEVLLAHALGKGRSFLHAWPERILACAEQDCFTALLERRLAGEPLAYIIGRREFWSLELTVAPGVLIPRPETEQLVELALDRLAPGRALQVADLGTGSGAVALAIAQERPQVQVLATDVCARALAIARRNARGAGVTFRQGDWYQALAGERFDCIVSNPPYVAANDPHLRNLRFEPRQALVAGPDGLDAIRTIIRGAPQHLRRGGWLLLEHGHDQGEQVVELLQGQGFTQIEDISDAAGHPRIGCGRLTPPPSRSTFHC